MRPSRSAVGRGLPTREEREIVRHPKVALEPDPVRFEASLELRDDPLLRPDEFKLVIKSAGRDVTQQYAVA